MRRPHPSTFFPPPVEQKPSRLRAVASVVAALCGGFAVLGLALLIIGSVSPADSPWAYVGGIVLALVWLTGIWSRWDSPDRREPREERERHGY